MPDRFNRRLLLHGLAGAAFAAPQNPSCSPQWGTDLKPNQLVPPAGGAQVIPNGAPDRQRRRPLFSEMKRDPDLRQRVMADLEKGYTALMCASDADLQDHTGLMYWAWMHEHYCGGAGSHIDYHHSWLFLPWHRALLYFHELTLRKIVGDDFRLPVWDWETTAEVPSFYSDFVTRFKSSEKTSLPGRIENCMLQAWLLCKDRKEIFIGEAAKGGLAPAGAHNYVHTQMGPLMNRFSKSGADPLFYAHHANVDRWWAFWQSHYSQFGDPTTWPWSTESFNFYGPDGQPASIQVSRLFDLVKLGYSYAPVRNPGLYDYRSQIETATHGVFTIQGLQNIFLSLMRIARMPVASLAAFLDATEEHFFDAVSRIQNALPVRITITPTGAQPGTYYYIGMRGPSMSGDDPAHVIGGFSPLSDSDMHHSGTIVAACFGLEDLLQIAKWHGQVRFVWGPAAPDHYAITYGAEHPIDSIELLIPIPA